MLHLATVLRNLVGFEVGDPAVGQLFDGSPIQPPRQSKSPRTVAVLLRNLREARLGCLLVELVSQLKDAAANPPGTLIRAINEPLVRLLDRIVLKGLRAMGSYEWDSYRCLEGPPALLSDLYLEWEPHNRSLKVESPKAQPARVLEAAEEISNAVITREPPPFRELLDLPGQGVTQ